MPSIVKEPIRVLLIDNDLVVRAGLRMLIQSWRRMEIVGEARTPAEALAIISRETPDIILLELDLGEAGIGLDLLPELLSVGKAHIIILTSVHDPEAHYRAMRLGAMGLVLKDQSAEVLHKAILKVHAGEAWLDPKLMRSVITRMSRAGGSKKSDHVTAMIASLTKREHEVVALVGEGLKNKDIARRLFISETTVRHHLTSIFSKLEVSDRLELLVFLYRHKLVKLSH